MKNVTITLDDETARWARIEAAKRDTSMSKLVGELLRQHMRAHVDYERALERSAARKPKDLSRGKPYPEREDLYDRARLR